MRTSLLLSPIIILVVSACVTITTSGAWQSADSLFPSGTRTLYAFEQGGLLFRTIIVPETQFNLESIVAIAKQFTASSKNLRFAELIMGGIESDLRKSYYGTYTNLESEPSFAQTLEQIGSPRALPITPLARVLVFNGAALFSYR